MNSWVNGRAGTTVSSRDRGLHYGDGLFETMRVRRRTIRLLEYHLERLIEGCSRLALRPPPVQRLRGELIRIAAERPHGVLKLIVTRGVGPRGYRPTGRERSTRLISIHPLPAPALRATERPVRVRLCATRLGINPMLAGLKTLNRLESVLARAEWSDLRVWEGLMRDTDDHIVCGTMSNVFVRQGCSLTTPRLDRCGVAGVMRRWVLAQADSLHLRAVEGRLRWDDLGDADEIFMTNAVAGIVPVAVIRYGPVTLRPKETRTAHALRVLLDCHNLWDSR